MVFFFESPSCPGFRIYMGVDKYENEELIKYGFPEDVWFHVNDYSSAHVYVRLNKSEDWLSMPLTLRNELCQLVKHNSIEGSKKSSVDVVYTPWSNLKKLPDNEPGQVSFKDIKLLKKVKAVAKDRELIKAIEKVVAVDLQKEQEQRFKAERLQQRKEKQEKERQNRQARIEQEESEKLRTYAALQSRAPTTLDDEFQEKGDGTIESCREIEADFL